MTSTTNTVFNNSNVRSLIEGDINACTALLNLLEQEREALKERSQERLEEILQAKADHLCHLENSAKIRSEWAELYNAGGQSLEEKWHAIIAQQSSDIATLWHRLKDLLQNCRRENEVNGKILARNQKTFSRIISILRGQSTSTNLYTSKGNRNPHIPGERLGEA